MPLLLDGAQRYADLCGFALPALDVSQVRACPDQSRRIARSYLAAPTLDETARPAYDTFREETWRQFDFLIRSRRRGGVGLSVTISDADPYKNVDLLLQDMSRRRLHVWSTKACGSSHPLLSDDDNDAFRAVHDAFGHGATGCGFDADGEEGTWLKHSAMYSPLARMALATETRGQNSVIYTEGYFPPQKAVLLHAAYGPGGAA